MIKEQNRLGLLFLTILFGIALILTSACSREEESLKIVIEDSPGIEVPASKDSPGGGTSNYPTEPEQYLTPGETGAPVDKIYGGDGDIAKAGPGMEVPPKIEESDVALAMNVLDVMSKVRDDEDFKKIVTVLPVRVTIFGLPKNRAWNVRVMFQKIELMEVVIDDNSGDILGRRVQKEHDIRTLARKTKPGARRMKEYLESLNLGYTGALNAVLVDERCPKIDYTKHVIVTVLLGRGTEKQIWHVVFMPGEDKLNIIATTDDYGNVLSVKEEERKVKR